MCEMQCLERRERRLAWALMRDARQIGVEIERVGGHWCTPTLAASLANSAAALRPKAGAQFAPWGGPAALGWTPTLAALAAALPPKAGAQFAPLGGPAAIDRAAQPVVQRSDQRADRGEQEHRGDRELDHPGDVGDMRFHRWDRLRRGDKHPGVSRTRPGVAAAG